VASVSAESTYVAGADLLDRCQPIAEAGYAMSRGFDEDKMRVET
jgi:DMSO/TMAO reductase YedYZ molybdopterin-dependent catalytic subunit